MDEEQVLSILRKERDRKRTIYIEVSQISASDFSYLRKNLRRRAFKLVKNVPCVLVVKDDENVNIRNEDLW